MADNFAINPDTGEAVIWSGGAWRPAPVADNPETGEQMAFNGAEWVKLPPPPQRADSIAGAIKSIWDNPAPGAIRRGPLDPSLIGMIKGAWEGIQGPGRAASGAYNVTPEVPGQWSEADEFRSQHARQQMQGDAGNLAGVVMAGTLPRVAAAGGKLDPNTLGMNFSGPINKTTQPSQPFTPPQAGQIVDTAQRVGVEVPRFITDPSRMTQGIAAGLQNIPGVGDTIATATQNTVRQLGNATNRVGEGYGTGSPVVAGNNAKDAIVGWITEGSNRVANRLYDSVDAVINPAVKTELRATAQAAQDILSARANAHIPGKSAAVDNVFDAITTPGGLNYQGIKELRSFMGEMTPEQLAASGLRAGEVKRLYGALSTDLAAVVKDAGGTIGTARFEKANRLYDEIVDRRKALSKIIGAKGDAAPEAVFARLVAMAGSKSSADAGRLAMARKTIGPEAWNELASAIVSKLGRDTRGEFSVQRFLTAYGNMSADGRRVLFKTTGRDNLGRSLDDIASLTKEIEAKLNQFSNPSGTGRSLTATDTAMQAVHSPLRLLATITGARAYARLYAEPASARLTADWLKAYRDAIVAPHANASAAVRAAAQKLADDIVSRSGGDASQVAAQLSLTGLFDQQQGPMQ